MEFLVRIVARLPDSMDAEARAELLVAEVRRGRELVADGTIRRIWRLPGRQANVGIWDVADADALHHAITSLPMFPWFDVEVDGLASHPLESALEDTRVHNQPRGDA